MTEANRTARDDAAAKSMIIERDIILRLESLGRELSIDRRAGLEELTKPELQQLAVHLKAATSAYDASTMVMHAIHGSRDANRKAEEEKEKSMGPATVSMTL